MSSHSKPKPAQRPGQGSTSLSTGGSFAAEPRKAIHALQSGLMQRQAMKELGRQMQFQNAVGSLLPTVLHTLSEDVRSEVLAAMACAAPAPARRLIMEHPACPEAVAQMVEAHDADKQREAEARKAEKARIAREKKLAQYEKLKAELEGDGGSDTKPAAAE